MSYHLNRISPAQQGESQDSDTAICALPGCTNREDRAHLSPQGFCRFCARTPSPCHGCGHIVQLSDLNDESKCPSCAGQAVGHA